MPRAFARRRDGARQRYVIVLGRDSTLRAEDRTLAEPGEGGYIVVMERLELIVQVADLILERGLVKTPMAVVAQVVFRETRSQG